MNTKSNEDLLDRLVGEYSDRLARGTEARSDDLLAQVGPEHREALERCFRMVKAGLASAPRASRALLPGTQLGNYKLVREIGRGGMSIVFLAEQLDLRRPVALKVLRPGLAVEAQHVERFQREAMSIARLQHPHIVQVYAVGENDGWHWLAMEYVEGENLAQIYARLVAAERDPSRWTVESFAQAAGQRATSAEARSYASALCALLAPVARAVGVAHEIGLVHRDIKPSNILVHKDGRALIADFGLAKGDGDPGLSLTGEPIGTPYYMSPEQALLASHAHVDKRTDVYSLGVTLYEGLTGRRPFEGDSPLAVLDAIRSQVPPTIHHFVPKCDREVELVVERAMSPAREDRYANAFDLAHDLDAIVTGAATVAGARHGGEWQRYRRARAAARRGQPMEYRTRGEFLGLPWVHIVYGRTAPGQKRRMAKGWFASGEFARGVFACGGIAQGLFAFGGLAMGGFTIGGATLGLGGWGGFAAGLIAYGGVSVGYVAVGGVAAGEYATGGAAVGKHVLTAEVQDPEAVAFFQEWLPSSIPSGLRRDLEKSGQ
jgi:serine/threonine protein kinase